MLTETDETGAHLMLHPGAAICRLDAAPSVSAVPSRRPFLTKRGVVMIAIFLAVLALFLTQTRLPSTLLKLETADRAQTARGRVGFNQVIDPEAFPPALRWVAYGANLWDGNAIGMFFAMLLGGAAIGFASPMARLRRVLERRGPLGAGVGAALGLPLMMCSACSTPVSLGFYRSGATVETSLGVIIGSALFNPLGLIAMFAVLPPKMGLARVAFGLVMLFVVAPLLARSHRRRSGAEEPAACVLPALPAEPIPPSDDEGWGAALVQSLRDWMRNSADVAWRLGPLMLAATLAVGVVFSVAPPQTFSDRLGVGVAALVLASAVGAMLQTPALFEVPLTLGLLSLGLGAGPATALLVTAPSAGLITLALARRELGWRTPLLLIAATFAGGLAAGAVVGAL
ncbi:MAG: permease [Actinobacteria bacterium]|nr:permease [Actinomycetota bacterium]